MAPCKALRVVAVAAVATVAVAQGWTVPPLPGMIVTTYPPGSTGNPGGEPAGSIPVTSAGSGPYKTVTFVPAQQATPAQLLAASSGQCNFLEQAFEDGFQYPTLNLTRWQSIAATALDHCPTPGAVGAANAATCTAMMASQVQLGVKLPGYPTGDLGMILTLSQKPCATPGLCCVDGSCANWAGAHLSSNGCILYGVLETEAAFAIPPSSGGVFFAGTYIFSAANALDPSWNEVDQTIINGPNGLEFHGSLFISNPAFASNAQEDKDAFDSTGTMCNSYVPPKGMPGNFKGASTPYNCPTFGTLFAQSYHTYKIVWTPTWIAWMIDTTVYRNSTSAPWRPVTMRPLLRTNVGTAASVAVLPDANVYIRRIRYTPLNWPGTTSSVIQDALTLPSMASLYGPLANAAGGALQLSTPNMAAAASAGRRHLLQLGPLISSTTGAMIPASANPPPALTGYQAELARVQNITATVVAAAVPGVTANMVATSITGHVITGTVWVRGTTFSVWTPSIQQALVNNLAVDVTPEADNVFVTAFLDASLPASWAACNTVPPSSFGAPGASTSGVLVSYMVDGYNCATISQVQVLPSASCTDAGFAIATADSVRLDQLGPNSTTGKAMVSLLGSNARVVDVSGGTGYPQISASIAVSINLFFSNMNGSTTTPASIVEASFDSMLNSGMLSTLLSARGIYVAAPSNAQTARLTKSSDVASMSPTLQSLSASPAAGSGITVVCPAPASAASPVWRGLAIAFIVAFGAVMTTSTVFLALQSRGLARKLDAVMANQDASRKIHPSVN